MRRNEDFGSIIVRHGEGPASGHRYERFHAQETIEQIREFLEGTAEVAFSNSTDAILASHFHHNSRTFGENPVLSGRRFFDKGAHTFSQVRDAFQQTYYAGIRYKSLPEVFAVSTALKNTQPLLRFFARYMAVSAFLINCSPVIPWSG